MAMTRAERLRLVVKWITAELGKSQQEIGEALGYPNGSYFSQLLNGKKPIAASLDGKLAALDPRINPAFLSGESSEMLLPGEEGLPFSPETARTGGAGDCATRSGKAQKSAGIFVPAELAQMVTDLSATVREQQRIIGSLVSTWIKEKEGGK